MHTDIIREAIDEKLTENFHDWHRHTRLATNTLNVLCNAIIESSGFEISNGHSESLRKNDKVQSRLVRALRERRERHLNSLGEALEHITACYLRIQEFLRKLESFCDTEAWTTTSHHDSKKFLQLSVFEEALQIACTSFGRDLECKRLIFADIKKLVNEEIRFTSKSRDELLIYIAVWSESPCINWSTVDSLEAAVNLKFD